MSDVVNESLYPGWGQWFRVTRRIEHVQSAYQDIQVFETAQHGRVVMLDGVVQITEADEFVYQEMLAHVPLLAHGNPRRVLIIGAGDGGVLRRVLQHRQVERVVMVEIDREVIRVCREHLSSIGGTAWEAPRAEVRIEDGTAFAASAAAREFDVIIVDSTDPAGPGEALFGETFYKNCARILSPGGIIVNQCGVPFMQADELRATTRCRTPFFPYVSAYVVAVPTYVGGYMAIGIAAESGRPGEIPAAALRQRAELSGVLGHTRYWSPEIQESAFHLPPYIQECLT